MFASSGIMLANTALNRIDLVMKAPTLKECIHPKTPIDNSVVFKNVSFTYEGSSTPALSSISLELNRVKLLHSLVHQEVVKQQLLA